MSKYLLTSVDVHEDSVICDPLWHAAHRISEKKQWAGST